MVLELGYGGGLYMSQCFFARNKGGRIVDANSRRGGGSGSMIIVSRGERRESRGITMMVYRMMHKIEQTGK